MHYKRKQQIWEGIATEENALGADRRTVAELNKNWAEMKSASLRILSERRNPKTGGGKKIPEPWFLTYVLDVLGVNTALVDGIAGKGAKLNKNQK